MGHAGSRLPLADRGVTEVLAGDGDGKGAAAKLLMAQPPSKVIPFHPELVHSIRVNVPAAKARAETIFARRTWKKEEQVGGHLLAVKCLDLTTLKGDDTSGRTKRICAKGLRPVEAKTLERLGLPELIDTLTVGGVCVYPKQVAEAANILAGRVPVASVATCFPSGQSDPDVRIRDIEDAIRNGADEIDVVISRDLALKGKWKELCDELVLFRQACGKAKEKVILGIGDLKELVIVAKASAVAIMAGADTIKTSTGFEATNATFEGGLVMLRQIRRFETLGLTNGRKIGFKPAGGISTAADALKWLILVMEELGPDRLTPQHLRLGASSVLNDLEQQLWHDATGHYSASHRHPVA